MHKNKISLKAGSVEEKALMMAGMEIKTSEWPKEF